MPGQFLDITVRCHHSEYRLLPTKERRAILGFWFAKAQQKFSGVRIFALAQMSNHLHLVILDRRGEVSKFMQYALSHAAKRINKIDHVRGAVFERRFAEIPILDNKALVDRIAYAVTNPTEASLVRSHKDWPGLCLFAGSALKTETFTYFHESRYQRALRESADTGIAVNRDDFVEAAKLEIDSLDDADVHSAIEVREEQLRKAQSKVAGVKRVLGASPFDRPAMSPRTKMPLCFGQLEARRIFAEGWHSFVDAYRKASSAFRAGKLDVPFPPFSFRPSCSAT